MSEPPSPHSLTPEDYRKRYFELKARAKEAEARRPATSLKRNPQNLKSDVVLLDEWVPAGWYWTGIVKRGQTLRIVNERATHGVSALFWNAADPSERYNAGDTVKVQWNARLSRGKLLLSDMGRVLCSITDDSCGFHDFIAGGSTRASDDAKFGIDPVRRNSRDNFVLAAAKHGLASRDVGPCITFFAPVVTDEDGRFHWQNGAAKAGDYVDLRAEMDLIAAVSNCPHPLAPIKAWQAEPVHLFVWRTPAPGANDFCRVASDEAVRAFENTDNYVRARG